jgi:hypothetical protein
MSHDMSSHLPFPKTVAALDPEAQADARLARLETTLLTVALIITLGVTSALSILVALV